MSLHRLYSVNMLLMFSSARGVAILKSVDISPCTVPTGGLQPCLRGAAELGRCKMAPHSLSFITSSKKWSSCPFSSARAGSVTALIRGYLAGAVQCLGLHKRAASTFCLLEGSLSKPWATVLWGHQASPMERSCAETEAQPAHSCSSHAGPRVWSVSEEAITWPLPQKPCDYTASIVVRQSYTWQCFQYLPGTIHSYYSIIDWIPSDLLYIPMSVS